MKKQKLFARAIEARLNEDVEFKIIHPLDLLRSKTENPHKLTEKAEAADDKQLTLTTQIVRQLLLDAAKSGSEPKHQRRLLKYIQEIFKISKSGVGRNARKHEINFFACIPPEIIASKSFHESWLPRIMHQLLPIETGQSSSPTVSL